MVDLYMSVPCGRTKIYLMCHILSQHIHIIIAIINITTLVSVILTNT
jgi:hypothetical protein